MCPSFNNFMKKEEKYIYELLIKALKGQFESLEKSEKYSEKYEKVLANLKEELDLTQENYKKKFSH
jgi:hypothetical protein